MVLGVTATFAVVMFGLLPLIRAFAMNATVQRCWERSMYFRLTTIFVTFIGCFLLPFAVVGAVSLLLS